MIRQRAIRNRGGPAADDGKAAVTSPRRAVHSPFRRPALGLRRAPNPGMTGQRFRPNAPRSEVGRRALPSLERNCNFAARAVRCEDQVNGAAEFMRNKIADEA
jgi:hypothetical protein